MRFKIDQSNYGMLPRLGDFLINNKIDKVEIEITDDLEKLPYFSDIIPSIYQLLDYEMYFQVWLKNIPICVISPQAIDHILPSSDFKGEKDKQCKDCYWNKKCSGFPKGYFKKYDSQEICPKPDLPEEIMIEVEPKCNFDCQFCFNKVSFAKHGRDIKEISTKSIKKLIDNITGLGIGIIRFTGGEPLLRKDIFQLLKYSKDKGLEVRLNTNGSLIDNKVASKLRGIVDNVLIPIESYTDKEETKLTNTKNSLKKKVKAIELLKKQNIPVVRAGTVATQENILSFDKIAQFISKLPLDEWELYRPVPISKKKDLNSKHINILVDKLINLRKATDKPVFIANAIPFCSIKDMNRINSVSKGALHDDGHSRLVIDPRGFVKPHYFLNEDLGSFKDIIRAWHNPFIKKMRNLEFLPKECQNCPFSFKCRGGSRHAAKIINGGYDRLDPLAKYYGKS